MATDDGTVASDDSLGRDWTRVRDVESPTGLDEARADAESDARRAEASGEEKMDEPEPEPEESSWALERTERTAFRGGGATDAAGTDGRGGRFRPGRGLGDGL